MSVPCVGVALQAVLVHSANSMGFNAFVGSTHLAALESRRMHPGSLFALPALVTVCAGQSFLALPQSRLRLARKADLLDALRHQVGLADGLRVQHEENLLALRWQI